jgi:hypothetical protein
LASSAQWRNELLLIILLKILTFCGAAAEDGTAPGTGDGLMSPLTSVRTSVVIGGSSVSGTLSLEVNEKMSIPPLGKEKKLCANERPRIRAIFAQFRD